MWDIDHFKKVNDTYGHDAGDRVLKLLSKIITTRVRKVDMFARIGGEEFCILLPKTPSSQAHALAEKCRQRVEEESVSGVSVTISLGVSSSTDGAECANRLVNQADVALYESKRLGRNKSTIWASDLEPDTNKTAC